MASPETTYDPEADALYILLAEDGRPVEAEEVSPGVMVDFDSEGRVVGIEVMPASLTLAPGSWKLAPAPMLGAAVIAAE